MGEVGEVLLQLFAALGMAITFLGCAITILLIKQGLKERKNKGKDG